MTVRIRAFACTCALVASASAQAATAWLGIDFDNLQYQLIDLAPGDGIAPSLELGFIFGDTQGPGGNGPFVAEPFQYGTRFSTTGPNATYFLDDFVFYDSVLSPNTAAVFSVAGFVGASASAGETAAVHLSFEARGSSSAGSTLAYQIGADAATGGPSGPVFDQLQVRIENRSAVSDSISIGYTSSVSLVSRTVAPVPEPGTWAMLALGLPMLLAGVRRSKRRAGAVALA